MADINVERKSPTGWIWWLLGLVILGLLLFWLLAPGTRDQVALVDDPATEPMPAVAPVEDPEAVPMEVQQYREQCAPREPGAMGMDHDHTANCLRMLVDAMEASVPQDRRTDVQPQLESARESADQLATSPADALTHSQLARDGFTATGTAAQQIQEQWYTHLGGEARGLNEAAEAVDPNVPLLDQSERVQAFFAQGADLVEQMNQGQTTS